MFDAYFIICCLSAFMLGVMSLFIGYQGMVIGVVSLIEMFLLVFLYILHIYLYLKYEIQNNCRYVSIIISIIGFVLYHIFYVVLCRTLPFYILGIVFYFEYVLLFMATIILGDAYSKLYDVVFEDMKKNN